MPFHYKLSFQPLGARGGNNLVSLEWGLETPDGGLDAFWGQDPKKQGKKEKQTNKQGFLNLNLSSFLNLNFISCSTKSWAGDPKQTKGWEMEERKGWGGGWGGGDNQTKKGG